MIDVHEAYVLCFDEFQVCERVYVASSMARAECELHDG